MKKIVTILVMCMFVLGTTVSCVKSSKSCKASHKKMKKMRKSGQLKM
jgi:hypothetical protein